MAQLRQKLNKTNDLLAKLRPQVSSSLLKTIYFAFFDSHLCYTTQVWSNNVMDLIKRTQNKALQIISFKDRAEPSNSLYANHKILKLQKSLHWIVACLSIYIFDQLVITYQILSQIISNFLKISTGPPQGIPIISCYVKCTKS